MNAEDIANYLKELENDKAILELRVEKRMVKVRTLRNINAGLKYDLDKCKSLWRMRP